VGKGNESPDDAKGEGGIDLRTASESSCMPWFLGSGSWISTGRENRRERGGGVTSSQRTSAAWVCTAFSTKQGKEKSRRGREMGQ